MTALSRVKDNTVEKRLLNSQGLPNFGLSFYVVNKAGDHAGVSMYTSAPFGPTRSATRTVPSRFPWSPSSRGALRTEDRSDRAGEG